MSERGVADFSSVTEVIGNRLTAEAISMMFTRYRFGAALARGKDVLEVACGSGQGLGLLAASARRVVGGDFTASLAEQAGMQYKGRVPVLRLDAHALPFRHGSFDVALLYEAVYYLADVRRFLREARRVLRPGGSLVVCSANPQWSDFNPSPHSVRYYAAREIAALLDEEGFRTRLLAAYPAGNRGVARRMVSWIRRAAVAMNVMPKTMKGKEFLKRLFYGSLVEMPPELPDGQADVPAPVPVGPETPGGSYKVFFAVGTRN